jgi:hypothetical protein
MGTAMEALDRAAACLDDVVEGTRLAARALDGVAHPLVDRAAEVTAVADDLRLSVVRARDALIEAGA